MSCTTQLLVSFELPVVSSRITGGLGSCIFFYQTPTDTSSEEIKLRRPGSIRFGRPPRLIGLLVVLVFLGDRNEWDAWCRRVLLHDV